MQETEQADRIVGAKRTANPPRLVPSPPCLLWDVDGTLTDTTALIAEALDHIYRKFYGRALSFDDRRALIGTPLKKQIRIFGEPESLGVAEEEITEEFITFYEQQKSRERLWDDVIASLIEGKRRGFPTGLVTSKNREELANTLPRLGIADYIDSAVTADDVAHPKPDPEGIRLALRRLAIPAERIADAVYIGDTLHDMRAARDAGVRGIAVTWGAATRAQMEQEAPAFLCDTPAELRHLLFTAP